MRRRSGPAPLEQAAAGYRSVLKAARELADLDPANPTYRHDAMAAEQRLADLDRRAGRVEQAAAGYRSLQQAARGLADLDPAKPTYRRDVMISESRLADLDRQAGRPE